MTEGLRYFVGPAYKPNGPDDKRQEGDEIPEAADWNCLDVWIAAGAVVMHREPPPKATAAVQDPGASAPQSPDPPSGDPDKTPAVPVDTGLLEKSKRKRGRQSKKPDSDW